MKTNYYIYNAGTLSRKDNTLQFSTETGKRDLPFERIENLYVMSETTLNSALLNFIGANGIFIHFFNYYQFYTGSFVPRETRLAGNLTVQQAQCYLAPQERLSIAKEFIDSAASNIYRNLRYYNGRGKDLSLPMAQIQNLQLEIPRVQSVQELMGVEGTIRKIYYETWNTLINQDISFEKRVKNPPDNAMNSLISFVNILIYTRVLSEIYHTQLNATISFLHEPGVRRFSLCLDIAEVFKPILGDRLIFSLLNRNQITDKSFTRELNGLHLTKEASQLIVKSLDERLETTIHHKELNRKVSYQYLIRLECWKLVKHILGEKPYDGFKIWW